MKKNQLQLAVSNPLGRYGIITPTGWRPPKDMTFDDWVEAGRALAVLDMAIGWAIGEWWRAFRPAWGDQAKLFLSPDWKGPAYETVRKSAAVCAIIESGRRRPDLSFTHHREAAQLPDASDQDAILDEAQRGNLSTRDVRNRVREMRRSGSIARLEFPSGTYPILYADPPWRYDFSLTDARAIENQYPTMSIEEICALAVPDVAADNAMLFMWTTSPKLEEAFGVLKAWGFSYRSNHVWDKEHLGMGYYSRGQHEHLLVAKRGEMPPPPESTRVGSVIRAPMGEHSAKPERFYELIESWYPGLPKVELFARNLRPGWAAWGNQVPAHVAA